MAWTDYFKIFTFGFQKDPNSKVQDTRNLTGAGIAQADALQTFAGDDVINSPAGLMAYRQTNDMIDITTLTNRTARYKEYERLRNLPEIETVMTVISDEACVVGSTQIATPFGFKKIEDLVEKSPDDRFLVYCYDSEIKDYTLGWAYHPRLIKKDKTITVILDDGSRYAATADHKVLLRSGEWTETGKLKVGDNLMAFYRLPVNSYETKLNKNQFPRIFTYNKGWTHERLFVDEWRSGKQEEHTKRPCKILHMISKGLALNKVSDFIGLTTPGIVSNLKRIGFTTTEATKLSKRKDYRRVVGVFQNQEEENVYDISVEKHKCFCTDSIVLHNCQKDQQGNICRVETSNDEVRNELEFLFFHRQMLNINRNGWSWFKNLCVNGDHFIEIILDPDHPEEGIFKAISLPAETMYRIETIRGKLIEFQQSKEGPDYSALMNPIPLGKDNFDLQKSNAIRFNLNQVVHFRIGEDRKLF